MMWSNVRYPHLSIKQREIDARALACPRCGVAANEPCRSMDGKFPTMKTLHDGRLKSAEEAHFAAWKDTPEGKAELGAAAKRQAEREAQLRLAELQRQAAAADRERRRRERQDENSSRYDRRNAGSANDRPEPSGTYRMKWELQWTDDDDEKPDQGDGVEWFPFGVDYRGRVCWRRPIVNKPEHFTIRL